MRQAGWEILYSSISYVEISQSSSSHTDHDSYLRAKYSGARIRSENTENRSTILFESEAAPFLIRRPLVFMCSHDLAKFRVLFAVSLISLADGWH